MKNKTKRKNRIFRVLLATMLILFGVSFRNDGKIGISGVQSVQAATKNVVVRFWNQSGKTSYSKLRIKVSAGKKIKLPAVPAIQKSWLVHSEKRYQSGICRGKKNTSEKEYKSVRGA